MQTKCYSSFQKGRRWMDWREELSEFIKEYREIRTQNKMGHLVEEAFKAIPSFQEKLIFLIDKQTQKQKQVIEGKIKFIFLCRTLSSDYTGSYESILGMSDDMLYLDEKKSQVFWHPVLFDRGIDEDLRTAEKILRKNFLRLEEYELFYIKRQLLSDDWELFMKCFQIMSEQSVSLIRNSGLRLEDELSFLYGNYMDNLKIIWHSERGESDG